MQKKIFFTAFLTVAITASAQLSQKFDALFECYYQNGLFEGTVLIADSTGIVYHKSFGNANQEYQIPNDTTTIFRLGSLEKQFTAMLVLQLIEKGKLKLEGKITEYLPNYRKDTGTQVNIEQLLTHTSGIPNYTALPNVWNDSLKLNYQHEYLLKKFCSGDLEFKPGTQYKYSNTDYFILSQILRKVTETPLALLLKENILTPLGMHHTGLVDNITPLPNKAFGYYRLANTYVNEPYIYVPNIIGSGSIYSNAYDLFLWDRALYTNKLLSPENLKSYCSSHFQIEPDYSYGYGWEFTQTVISSNDTIKTMEHSGAIRAFRSNIFRIPNEKKCIILLSNCANQSAYELFENIINIFREKQWQEPPKLLADILYPIMQKGSIEHMIETYHQLKKSDNKAYDYSSNALELFAERLMLLQNYAAASAIFQLAVQEEPNYIYGYFFLGKVYEKMEKPDEAVKSYQIAVSKDKNSRPGIDASFQLKRLTGQK